MTYPLVTRGYRNYRYRQTGPALIVRDNEVRYGKTFWGDIASTKLPITPFILFLGKLVIKKTSH